MRILSDLPLRLPRQNKSRDIRYIIAHLTETLGEDALPRCHVQWRTSCFTVIKRRLVGKLTTPDGTLPFLLPIHRTDEGELFVDTCLTTTAEASIVFGLPALILWCMRRCLPRWLSGCVKSCRVKPLPNCIWRLAARNMRNRKLPRIFVLSG